MVSIVGSGLVTQGISQDVLTGSFLDIMATPGPNWTRHGRPLPYLPDVVTPAMRARVAAGDLISLRMAFEPALARTGMLAAATIPVERINGPVLLISGEQDQGYGPAFHQVAADRLAAHHHPHPWEHVIHPGAGHLIAAPPDAPATRATSPGPGITFEHGGTPAANAAARSATWRHILRFLTLATAGLRGGPGGDRAAPQGRLDDGGRVVGHVEAADIGAGRDDLVDAAEDLGAEHDLGAGQQVLELFQRARAGRLTPAHAAGEQALGQWAPADGA